MESGKTNIRKPSFAGSFYPAEKTDMLDLLHDFDWNSKDLLSEIYQSIDLNGIHGLIVPHAGWVYSGKTAFVAYQLLKKCKCRKIALLGPSHQKFFHGALADNHESWNTPLGDCSIFKDDYFPVDNEVHEKEHSLEVQMPFIHYASPSSEVLPLVVGEVSEHQAKDYSKHLMDEDYFVIISSDLSHYHPLNRAKIIDAKTIEAIEKTDENNIEACGRNPLKVAFVLMGELNQTSHLIHYSTSAEAFGDATSVVGYASFWF